MGLVINMLQNMELIVLTYEYDPHPSGLDRIHTPKILVPYFISISRSHPNSLLNSRRMIGNVNTLINYQICIFEWMFETNATPMVWEIKALKHIVV